MNPSLNPDDTLQLQVKTLLNEKRTPDLIPAEVGIHMERETGANERPCLVIVCTDGRDLHPKYRRTTLTLRGRVRPLQPAATVEGEPTPAADPAAATMEAGTWHAAAVQLFMDNLVLLTDRLAAQGLKVRILKRSGFGNAPDADNGWQYNQMFQVDLETKLVS